MPPFRAAISSTSKESNGDVSAVTNYCDKTVSSEVNCTKQPTQQGEKLWSSELIKMVDSSVEFAEEPHDETTTTGGGERQVEKIARKELRVVLALRCVVLLTILCACVVISTFTYYYLRGEDVDDYMLSVSPYITFKRDATELLSYYVLRLIPHCSIRFICSISNLWRLLNKLQLFK